VLLPITHWLMSGEAVDFWKKITAYRGIASPSAERREEVDGRGRVQKGLAERAITHFVEPISHVCRFAGLIGPNGPCVRDLLRSRHALVRSYTGFSLKAQLWCSVVLLSPPSAVEVEIHASSG